MAALGMVLLFCGAAGAQTCSVPYSFSNGVIADATQVNANFTALVNCATANVGLPHVATLAAQKALQTSGTMYRDGYYAAGDGGGATYVYSAVACTLNSGAGDNGSQVAPTTGGGCWNADFGGNPPDVRVWGVKADGSTSDDASLASALSYCGSIGGSLSLPAKRLRLTGASGTIAWNRCTMIGQGVMAYGSASIGTMIELTSTSVVPFTLGSGGVGIYGINFYWPNQTSGTTVYPALFTDTSSGVSTMWWDHVNIANAYNGYVANASSAGIGRWYVTNSNLYAVNDLFKLGSTGDFFQFSNVVFDPGAWLDATTFSAGTQAAINAADQLNTMFHFTAPTGGSGATLYVNGGRAFAWRYGVKLDATASWSFGDLQVDFDGVATHIDTSSGGTIGNVQIQCTACTAGIASYPSGSGTGGNFTAYNLGANSGTLRINNSLYNTTAGSFIITAGNNVELSNVKAGYGSVNDGSDYYGVKATSASILVRGSLLSGVSGSTKHHALKTTNGVASVIATGNKFIYNNDFLDIVLSTGAYGFFANHSENTQGASGIITSGTGFLGYGDNNLDKPPLPTVANCGSGAALGGGTAVSGYISVGSTNPTTSCELTMPFPALNGICVFSPSSAVTLYASPSGTPSTWTIQSDSTMHTGQIFYSCPAQK